MVDAFRLVMEGMEKVGNVATGTSTGNGSGAMGGKGTDKTLGQQLKKMAGIDLGVSALLKQSQIFTGYLGNIFAIVGALIDTILAPLAPIAFKALADLGKKIPAIAKMAEKYIPKVVEFLGSVARGIDNIMKVIHNDWAKWFGIALVTLDIKPAPWDRKPPLSPRRLPVARPPIDASLTDTLIAAKVTRAIPNHFAQSL